MTLSTVQYAVLESASSSKDAPGISLEGLVDANDGFSMDTIYDSVCFLLDSGLLQNDNCWASNSLKWMFRRTVKGDKVVMGK